MGTILKLDTKELILSCCEKIIALNGVNNFSLKDVAKAANISAGTLYYYYKTKGDLIIGLLERHMNNLRSDFNEWLIKHKDGTISKRRFIEIILLKSVRMYDKSKIRLYLINECLSTNTELKNRYLKLYKEWEEEIVKGLELVYKDIKNKQEFAHFIIVIIDGLTIEQGLENLSEEEFNNIKNTIIKYGDLYGN